jgi:uncharacterized membrane protein
MTDLHQIFDSLIGYLVGMAFVEAILKPAIVRMTKKALKKTDESMNDLLPNWMWDETESD